MKKEKMQLPQKGSEEALLPNQVGRRKFLTYVGLTASIAGASAFLVGCNKDDDNNGDNGGVNLGSGDIGILNYAYALEQLEAAFYTRVIASQYSGITASELALLTDIRDHEVAHREFFKKALAGNAIGALEVNFASIDFSSRTSVLNTAKAFEDLGVSAYNGAGKLITTKAYLELAGKIVSVEARHAGYIRDLLSNGSFADSTVVNAQGLDLAKSPSEVLNVAGAFLKTKVNASNLPTS
ncbi:ferritin-like domain-containing protein [Pseudoflavitalea sp. G-6-1-2]|uniref:ferritin-like domain-containing protein n=1 Tax=Pseudoflavitalea sp. G-6-1-2 TaxID=2728841 RepID=UPI00146D0E47|nr:ferritin-like domain-containing protein [Pseudoflavitalea sp. G-6-1-2]NML21859.1 ferritin-like domain-containing protein [Pseudoflavitalea sp. G-6-1-2]